MGWRLSNFAQLTLLQSAQASDTSLYVSVADAALLPSLGVGDKAKAVLFDGTSREIVNITAVSSGTLTVERAKESTSARAWPAGTVMVHTPTAEILQAILSTTAAVKYIGTATGTDAYTLNVGAGNPLPGLVDGEEISFIIPNTNTGASTVVITDGTTTTAGAAIVHPDGSAMDVRDLTANTLFVGRYSSTLSGWAAIDPTSYNVEAYQINDGPVPAVNRHPNGRVDFWNNGVSFSSPVTGTETADGWYVDFDGTIGTYTISRQSFPVGDTNVDGQPRYFYRWDHSVAGVGSTKRRIKVPLPGVQWQNGKKISRSVWMKAEAAHTVAMKLVQSFGTGGAPSADVTVVSQNCSVTTSWQKFKIEGQALPSISGKTLGSGGDDALVLYLELPVNTVMTIDVTCDDIRPGNMAGIQDFVFPAPWWMGGTGGSFSSGADFLTTAFPVIGAINLLSGNGLLARTSSTTAAARTLQPAAAGLTWTNGDGVAGDPVPVFSTALVNYLADPLSAAELASVTGAFGTAAFLPDSNIVHIAGTETVTGAKTFSGGVTSGRAVDTDNVKITNTTTTHYLADRFASAGVLYEMTPAPSGTPDNTKGFGFDFTNSWWFVDTAIAFPNGAAATPSVRVGTEQHGLFRSSSTALGFSVAGVQYAALNTSALDLSMQTIQLRMQAGSVGAPSIVIRSADTTTGLYSIATGQWGFASGGVLAWDANGTRVLYAVDAVLTATVGPTSAVSVGYRGTPQNAGVKATNYTGVLTDAGAAIPFSASATFTIDTNANVPYPTGQWLFIPNLTGSGALTIAAAGGVTLQRGDGTAGTGSRTVSADTGVWLYKHATNTWYIYGNFT